MAEATWWQRGVIYQIYPRSFMDGDGDGVGDLPGILRRLDHLPGLGADPVWLSPVHPRPWTTSATTSATTPTSTRCSGPWPTWTSWWRPPTAGAAGAAGLGAEPHLRPAPLVPGLTGLPGRRKARLVRLARPPARRRPADQLAALHRRQRLVLGRAHRPVLLPRVPGLPARPELAQPPGPGGHVRHPALLAGPGDRRVPHRRPDRAGRGRAAGRQPAQPRLPTRPGHAGPGGAVGLERGPARDPPGGPP